MVSRFSNPLAASWRRRYKELFVLSGGFFCAGFSRSAVSQFAELRGPLPPGAEARRFGCRRTRYSAGCVRSVQEECMLFKFASFASVGAVLFSCRSPRGEFCEPPQGGISARPAESRCLRFVSSQTEHRTTIPASPTALPPVLHIPVCCGAENNSKCTIQNSQLRSSSSF